VRGHCRKFFININLTFGTMKTSFIKFGLLLILFIAISSLGTEAQTTIYANGSYTISDPEHPTATFNVYAFIETSEAQYPCNSNPIATGVTQNTYGPVYLTFPSCYPPDPPPANPYKVVLYVQRVNISPYIWRTGESDWDDEYGFSPWNPDPIKVEEFN